MKENIVLALRHNNPCSRRPVDHDIIEPDELDTYDPLADDFYTGETLPRFTGKAPPIVNLGLLIETDPVPDDRQWAFADYLQWYLQDGKPYPDAVALAAIATELFYNGDRK